MDKGRALRQALESLIGQPFQPAPTLPPAATSWAEIVDRFGGRVAVADYLGAKGHNRRRLLANLRNWQRGHDSKAPRPLFRRLARYTPDRRAATRARRRANAEIPRTLEQVIDAIERHGVTVGYFHGHLEIVSGKSKQLDAREREISESWFIPAATLVEVDFFTEVRAPRWHDAADAFADAFADAYGIGQLGATFGDVTALDLEGIGDRT